MKVVIDPGHGGSDPGAVANGLQEKDITLLVGNELNRLLTQAGYDVTSTRTTDETLSLLKRSQIAAEENADLFVSVHVNAGGGNGTETYYSITDKDPKLAVSISDNISDMGFRNRGAKTRVGSNGDYYAVIRDTVKLSNAKPYLVELFFIDNIGDVDLYKKVGYQAMADAIYKAILKDFPITSPGSGQSYTVKRGDTLFSIANRFNTTVAGIKVLNSLANDVLYVGQKLLIPQANGGNQMFPYVVQRGDTLFSIANRFGITVDMLKRFNNLGSDLLMIGQQLSIPNASDGQTATFTHAVQRGDTLFSLANRFNTTVDTIRRINNLNSDLLNLGQRLQIPR